MSETNEPKDTPAKCLGDFRMAKLEWCTVHENWLHNCNAKILLEQLSAKEKEIERLKFLCAVEVTSDLLDENRELESRVKVLTEYARHEDTCACTGWEAGEPTLDGGYRTKIRGKWYQSRPVDETPKCDCGLDEAIDQSTEVKE